MVKQINIDMDESIVYVMTRTRMSLSKYLHVYNAVGVSNHQSFDINGGLVELALKLGPVWAKYLIWNNGCHCVSMPQSCLDKLSNKQTPE